MRKSIFGLSENIAGMLAYLFSWFGGIVVLIMERENKFVKFHALQSVIFFGALDIIMWIAGFIPFVGGLVSGLLGLVHFVAWIYLAYTTYKGQTFRIPIIGDVCWEQANK